MKKQKKIVCLKDWIFESDEIKINVRWSSKSFFVFLSSLSQRTFRNFQVSNDEKKEHIFYLCLRKKKISTPTIFNLNPVYFWTIVLNRVKFLSEITTYLKVK